MVSAEPLAIYVNGRLRKVLAGSQLAELVKDVTRSAIGTEPAYEAAKQSKLAAYVAWGAVLIQVRPHVKEGTFCQWLAEGGCKHRQKAYSAMKLASEFKDEHGQLDRAKLQEAIRKYNSACADRDGFMPLDEEAVSVNVAEIAAGVRQGQRKPVSGAPDTGKPGKTPAYAAEFFDLAVSLPDAGGAGSGGGTVGGKQIPMSAETVSAAHTAAMVADRVDPLSSQLAAGGVPSGRTVTSARNTPPATAGVEAMPIKRRSAGDVAGQLTLEDEYRAAAGKARDFARMLEAQAVKPELMERFMALVREAEVALPGGW